LEPARCRRWPFHQEHIPSSDQSWRLKILHLQIMCPFFYRS
jgi:hypothetical protein